MSIPYLFTLTERSGTLRSLTSLGHAVLFQPLLGTFLSKGHKSTQIITSNHDDDDPSHLVRYLTLGQLNLYVKKSGLWTDSCMGPSL